MQLKIAPLFVATLLLNIAISYGRTLFGKHLKACEPMTGLVRVKLPNCKESRVRLDQCIGTCLSWDGLPENDKMPTSKCTCCKPVTFREKTIRLECAGSYGMQIEEHTIREPIACDCLPCNRRRKRSQRVASGPSSKPGRRKRSETAAGLGPSSDNTEAL